MTAVTRPTVLLLWVLAFMLAIATSDVPAQPAADADSSGAPVDTSVVADEPLGLPAIPEIQMFDLDLADPDRVRASRSPLPKVPDRDLSALRAPPIPSPAPGDTIVVPQITEEVDDPELRAMADSLNDVLLSLGIQERLVEAQIRGESPRTGLIGRREYLIARANLLKGMESDLREQLLRRVSALDVEVDKLDSAVAASSAEEIATIEQFIADNPNSREVVDAKFVLGQLYYEREQQRFNHGFLRYLSENQRFRLGLVPVRPRMPVQNESVAVPLYQEVVEMGTNEQFIPYSLYSLGKYHIDLSRDFESERVVAQSLRDPEGARAHRATSRAHSDTAKYYFARLVNEFPDDTLNVPEAYYVLATHYNVRGGLANRDTAAVYAGALVRDHWYSPRYQLAIALLAQVNYYNGVATSFSDPEKSKLYYSDALAYLAWQSHEIDVFEAGQIPGVSPQAPPMMNTARRVNALQFMNQIITRQSLSPTAVPPPPLEAAMSIVNATQRAPFGADLLRQVGDKLKDRYQLSQDNDDLVTALTTYDSLLAIYPTYGDGPDIQQSIIQNATYLSNDPQERIRIFLRQKLSFFDRFNRNSDWARHADVTPAELRAVDDTAAAYLEQAATYLYTSARDAGDSQTLREALDYFVTYFQTYPERPQAYELNWSVATELRDLGDYDRAYDEFVRVSRSDTMDKYRQDAAIEAVAAAQNLVRLDEERQPTPEEGQ